jgi:hypothetical protein
MLLNTNFPAKANTQAGILLRNKAEGRRQKAEGNRV